MVATAHAIINDERHDNGTGRALTISNVLRPILRDYAVTNSASCIAPIAPVMSDDTASLLSRQ
jgi:methenyltetrahydromethanopterin cyclohydrolase